MKESGVPRARREAVQPSLWDRLVNDLPGVASEIEGLRLALDSELGVERVDALLAAGAQAIDAEAGLMPEQIRRLRRLLAQQHHRLELETRSIVVSPAVLREAVRRDIEALFNTERFESSPLVADHEMEQIDESLPDLDDFPEVRRSVVNFGVPSFSGRSARDFDHDLLAAEIQNILATFEPRLKKDATTVEVTLNEKGTGLTIEIDAVLIMTPSPERLKLRTNINLDNGAAVTELRTA